MSRQRSTPAVLAAKLVPPSPRAHAVRRPALIDRLESAGPSQLRAVIAPTGWGKSELIAQWLAAHEGAVAYVQLDAGDADAARAWAHVLVAIERATAIEVEDLVDALRSPGVALVREVVEPLLVRLADHPVTVVLEDLHLAPGAEMEESLAAFVDGRPSTVGVAFSSRIEPPLQLPGRRLQDGVVEIRVHDLRVDGQTAAAIVLDAAGIELDPASIELLVARTEGWAAGVYLAGLSLRGEPDPARTLERFAGDDRNVSEYLATEVLARLDPADRQFLVGSSVLHELDGELCDAVLDTTGSSRRLVDLARANQFLVPLDQREGRYRYHHLFREWLLLELDSSGSDATARAHCRAARAHLERGSVVAAVEHALDAGDAGLAYGTIIEHRLSLLDTSQHATIGRWYRRLPPPPTADDAVETHLLRAWVGVIEGDLDTIDRMSDRAADLLAGRTVTARVDDRAGEPDLLRAYAALLRGELERCRSTLAAATSVALPERAGPSVAWLDAVTRFWLGEPAQDALNHAYHVSRDAGVPYPTVLCQSYLALHAFEQHDPAAAERWTEEGFATTSEHRVSSAYLAGPHAARAQVRQTRGDLDGAIADAETAIELAERRNDTPIASLARLALASIHHTRGDRDAARELLDVVGRDLEPIGSPGILGARLATARRQLRLRQAPSQPRTLDGPVEDLTDREMALLRLLPGDLTQRELGDALHMSFNTVKTYNRQIYRKLGVSSRDDAVAAARAAGLL